MNYHINTGLIHEKFNGDCDCPLCEIEKIVEDQLIYEFLNDAVMEDNTRILVNKKGFCAKHFDLLFEGKNKLSLALQISTRTDDMLKLFNAPSSPKKRADELSKSVKTCVICDYLEESMVKYYKTIAQMFNNEPNFYKKIIATNGFCVKHYANLLRYSHYAGKFKKDYLETLSNVEKRSLEAIKTHITEFCYSHDYRNAGKPLGDAEYALTRMRRKLYGKKKDKN